MIAVAVLGALALGIALAGITEAVRPGTVATPWNEIAGWFGDWSEEAQRGAPYDWSRDMAELGRRFDPDPITERRAA